MKQILFSALMWVLCHAVMAQTTITVGSENFTVNPSAASPYSGWFTSDRQQFVYTATELSAAGMVAGSISSFAFKVVTVNTQNLNNYEIRMGHTTATDVAAQIDVSMQVVKNAHALTPGAAGWYTITFDQPFEWNGVENIVLDICYSRAAFTQGTIWMYNNVANQLRFTRLSSIQNLCNTNMASAQNGKPHAQFLNTAATCQLPNGLMASNITATGASISWNAPTLTPSSGYQFEVRTSGAPGSGAVGLVSSGSTPATTANISGLSELTVYRVYVRSDCGSSNFSAWSLSYDFRTLCSGPMSGAYTINQNAPATGSNFTSINQAVNRLIDCGINAAVTLDIVTGSGPYVEQIVFPYINGVSTTNTITITGNGNQLEYNVTADEPIIFRLDGAKHLTIDSLRIKSLNTTRGQYIQFTNNSDTNVIRNCLFDFSMINTASTSTGAVLFSNGITNINSSLGSPGSYNIIENNQMGGFGGHLNTGVFFALSATTHNIIRNNKIVDFRFNGITSSYCNYCIFEDNEIYRESFALATTATQFGINIAGSAGPHFGTIIRNNKIWKFKGNLAASDNSYFIGLNLGTGGQASAPLYVYNNIIDLDGTSGRYTGMFISTNFVKIYHNTVSIRGENQNTSAQTNNIIISGGVSNGFDLKNNIFTLFRGGSTQKTIISMTNSISDFWKFNIDNNVYAIDAPGASASGIAFSSSPNAVYQTLAQWQAFTNKDTNSVTANPVFVDVANLDFTPQSQTINNMGANLQSIVAFDIDGVSRSTTPDPGAIEFSAGTCVAPSNLEATNITATTATLNWIENGASTVWEVEYGTQGFTPGTGTIVTNINSKPTTITGLTELTNYEFYVRSNCGSNVFTSWEGPFGFFTECTAPMQGNYTINQNAAASATNFQSFADAVYRLHNCGISAPVEFNVIAGSGPYIEKVEITEIVGASATNTITFLGNGNTLQYNTSLNDQVVFYINGADYIEIDSLHVKPINTNYGVGYLLSNEANYNTIRNCSLDFSSISSSAGATGIGMSGSTTSTLNPSVVGSYNLFENNRVMANTSASGISYGITIFGNGTNAAVGNVVRGNQLINTSFSAISLQSCRECIIENNVIHNRTFASTFSFTAISHSGSSPGLIIRNNLIEKLKENLPTTSTKALTGINISAGGGTSANPMLMYNNIISLNGGSGTYRGIVLSGSNTTIYHNTIAIQSAGNTSGSSVGIDISNSNGHTLQNNILYINREGTGDKFGIRASVSNAANFASNYNSFFINTFVGATSGIGYYNLQNYATLGDWQTAISKDLNSVVANPGFVDLGGSNFTPTSALINNIGNNVLTTVATDFAGNARSATPDPGALEFNITSCVPVFNTITETACDSYFFKNMNLTMSGQYVDTLISQSNCDSIVTLNLTIVPTANSTTTISTCDSYFWNATELTYSVSGTYIIPNFCGADTLILTITPASGSTTTATACDTYTWNVNGTTYGYSGVFYYIDGCQSDTLDLTITPTTGSTITIVTCNSFLWSVNSQTYTMSGMYTETNGCNTDTLILTITPEVGSTTTQTACGSYLWSITGITYSVSGTYIETNNCGADTLILTITPISGSTIMASACDTYLWAAVGNTYTTSGQYYFTDGCNTDTLDLTINQSTSNTTTISASGSYTWPVNGVTYTQSGTYNFTNTNSAGCPNVETLNLTITTGSPCGPVTVTVSSPGLNAAWKSYGANNPNMFYYGIANSQRINANILGGIGPFTYSWSNSGGTNFMLPRTYYPANSIDILEPTAATTIMVVVTDQGTGCQYTGTLYMDWTDEYYCYKIGNTWYIKVCQNGQTTCVPWTIGRDLLRDGLATLGNCSNKFSTESTALLVDIFPNPTNGVFGLLVKNAQNNVHVEIFDMNGKRLGANQLAIQRGTATQEYDFTHLPAGMYYVQVNDGDIFITKKLVVQD